MNMRDMSETQQRVAAALNTPTSALKEIRELKARIKELETSLDERRRDMTMRDDIATIILRCGQSCDFERDTIFAADAIMHSLPELIPHYEAQQARITELETARDLGIIEGDLVAQLLVVAQQAQIEGLEATLQQERSAKWRLAESPLRNRVSELSSTLAWYKEQVYIFANDTTEKADEAYNALEDDGGKKARTVLKGDANED